MATQDLREVIDELMHQAAEAAKSCFRRGKDIVDDRAVAHAYTRDGARLIEQGNAIIRTLAEDQRKRDELKQGAGQGKAPEFTEAELDEHVTQLLAASLKSMTPEERAALEADVAVA